MRQTRPHARDRRDHRLDAYIRGYEMVVPPTAVAHIDGELAQAALKMMESNMHAELTPVRDIDFAD